MSFDRSVLVLGFVLSFVLAGCASASAAPPGDATLNRVRQVDPGPAPIAAREAHVRAVDLHADALLWHRDLEQRHAYGHVDLPRLRDGGVGLQVFSVVTHAPSRWGQPFYTAQDDAVSGLVRAQKRPAATHDSFLARALDQATALRRAVERSGGRVVQVLKASDLDRLDDQTLGALLSVEGLHVLGGQAQNVDVLFDAGVRMVGLTHFIDNAVGGSAHGKTQGGLTPMGEEVLRALESRGIAVDLAHASPALFTDVVARATRPIVVSHTGVRGTCDTHRNLTDAQLRAVAKSGGVVGIGYWKQATCGTDLAAFARAVDYAVKVAGPDHVALGSDFDGAVTVPVHVGHLRHVTGALLQVGLSPAVVEKVMRTNALRVLRALLPPDRG